MTSFDAPHLWDVLPSSYGSDGTRGLYIRAGVCPVQMKRGKYGVYIRLIKVSEEG